jgi:hypothetical protein
MDGHKMKSLNINCETGEETLVELTADEIATIETAMAEALAKQDIEPTIAEKLASVGLSIDELKAALSD